MHSIPLLASAALIGSLGPLWLSSEPPGTPTAVGERAGVVLVGTDRGLYREQPNGWSLVLTRGGVRDLASGERSTLIATASGLYEWPAERPEPAALRIGAGARALSVAIDTAGVEWVATEVGLFSRSPGTRSFERDTSLPAGEVVAVRAAAHEVWAAMRGALQVRRNGSGFEVALRQLDEGWWELLDALESPAGTLLCVPKGLWQIAPGGARAIDLAVGDLRGMVADGDAVLVAAERGVFRAPLVDLKRAALSPELDVATLDLAPSSSGLLVATGRGVARLRARPVGGPAPPLYRAPHEGDAPDIRTLHQAVLRYLELVPARIAALDARARHAPLWPAVRAGFSAERDHGRTRDRDQVLSSGNLFDLFDADASRGDSLALELELRWELADLADPDRAIAVSKERRELIELRDQVLDRVNRLYFERLRVAAALRALPAERQAERAELEIRANEIAAGLDAWSGGVFSRLTSGSPP